MNVGLTDVEHRNIQDVGNLLCQKNIFLYILSRRRSNLWYNYNRRRSTWRDINDKISYSF